MLATTGTNASSASEDLLNSKTRLRPGEMPGGGISDRSRRARRSGEGLALHDLENGPVQIVDDVKSSCGVASKSADAAARREQGGSLPSS